MIYSLIAAFGGQMASQVAEGTAEAGAQGTGGGISSIIMIVIFILIFYFLLLRPQKKKEKEAQKMLDSMEKGDKIVTIGGIRGTVVNVEENTVLIKVDDNTKITFNKSAISSVLNKKPVKVEKEEKAEAKEVPAEEKKEKKEKKSLVKKEKKEKN